MRVLETAEGADSLTVTVDYEDLIPLPSGVSKLAEQGASSTGVIIIPKTAIVNRMEFYGLEREDQAVDAILREHYTRLRGEAKAPARPWQSMTPRERAEATGALRNDVAIELARPAE